MKAFTDLEQSKKLAKILPLESADMWWSRCTITDFDDGILKVSYAVEPCNISQFKNTKEDVPCWSLSALLDVIPQEIEIKGQRYAPCLFPVVDGHWLYKLWYNSNEIIDSPCGVYCDNLIDACYEMIFQLKLYKPDIKWQVKKLKDK